MIALILACVEPDSEAKEDVPPLEEGFVGPVGRRLTGALKTWIDSEGTLHTRSVDNPTPQGRFREVSGDGVQCARDDVSVQCWGPGEYGEVGDIGGNFVQMSAGSLAACAVDPAGGLWCWGALSGPPQYTDVTRVAVGEGDAACLIDTAGTLSCWGASLDFYMAGWPRTGTWVDVAIGLTVACALSDTGSATCWGANEYPGGTSPDLSEVYTMVTAGSDRGCALTSVGSIECWYDGLSTLDTALDGTGYVEVSATHGYEICALTAADELVCSGDEDA